MDTATRIPLRRNPYWEWSCGATFTDLTGRIRATWELVNATHGCVYSVNFADGIPIEESAPEGWTRHTRISIRDEVTHHERQRIGAP